MSAANGSAVPQAANEISDKGKGKSAEQIPAHDIMEDDDEEDEEEDEEDGVEDHGEVEEEDEDNMEEIDPSNIVSGRTRGKNINWAEADQKAKEAGDDLDDDDEDDDEDFEEEEDDKMED